MKLDLSKVEFSPKDIRNEIKLPTKLTSDLAYLMGLHLGDGSMNMYKRKTIDYLISYTGHLIDEEEFHMKIIRTLFKKLFNKKTKLILDKRKNHSSLKTYFRSKAILTFFNKSLKLPLGSKKGCKIPKIILNSNIKIKKYFLKGLADTEFCLTFKKRYRQKHYYPAITFATESEFMHKSVVDLLKELHFGLYSLKNYITYRKGKKLKINTVDLNGLSNLNLWFKEIGFNSTKHLTKYQVWKKFGFCPPDTNIIERRNILKGKTDINSYYGLVA
tara:strand:- start:44061 stop:44879 length:819 start_codon:yes stop_codon:yes gene_type:complete